MKKGDFVQHKNNCWYVATKVGRVYDYVKLSNGEVCSQKDIVKSCKFVNSVCENSSCNSIFCVSAAAIGELYPFNSACHSEAYSYLGGGGECYTHLNASLEDEKVIRYYEWLIYKSPISFLFCKEYRWKERKSIKIVYKKGQSKAALRMACMFVRLPWDFYLDGHWGLFNYLIEKNIQHWLALMSLNMVVFSYKKGVTVNLKNYKHHLPFPSTSQDSCYETNKFLYLFGQENNMVIFFKEFRKMLSCDLLFRVVMEKKVVSKECSETLNNLTIPLYGRISYQKFLNFVRNIQKEF